MADMSELETLEQAYALAQAGRIDDAIKIVEDRAALDDPEAQFALGMWRVAGNPVPRDLDAAASLFERAASAGHLDAQHVHVAFVTHGAGGAPDWNRGIFLLGDLATNDKEARKQLEIIERMDVDDEGNPLSLSSPERLSDRPDVQVFRRLFTPEECTFLIDSAKPHFQPALVTDRSTGAQGRVPDRTADTAGFSLMTENPAVHALNRRLGAASGTTANHGEPLQVLRYDPGQEYRPHFDLLPPGSNQRCQTFLVYLNEGFEGGETSFLKAGLTFKGELGDGILFQNVLPNGDPDPDSLHAGLPVTRGTKLLASRWIRARPINLYNPLL
jgi:prolyl 4-hydroxylase